MRQDFGSTLRDWRQIRRMSQMDLGLSAGVSPRHISFLETGRSLPSRGMVLRLCEELEVPRAARNQLLTAAGMSPAYGSRALSDDDLAPLNAAVAWILQQHAPYPAMALDRHWRLVALNPTAETLLSVAGLEVGDNMIEALATNDLLRGALDNLDEVVDHSLARLRTELAYFGRDPELEAAIAALQATRVPGPDWPTSVLPAVIPARYRLNGTPLAFFSTIAQFGTVEDIAMSELRIEMMFPADDTTRDAVFAMAGGH